MPPVAHHQSVTGLVTPTGRLGRARLDLRLRGGCRHPPSTLADVLLDQGTGLGGAVFIDYAEHGRAFPTRAATRAHSVT
ncbi:hypothetical protein [Streptomyces sp. NPDC058572]|uniref:hypothetical protein n=1 Tax=Streptomyces sp. NPDC058572 TaxID=3346546 RepID=UPI003669463C